MSLFTAVKVTAALALLAVTAQSAFAQNASRPRVSGSVDARGAKDSTNTISAGTYVNTYVPTSRAPNTSSGQNYGGGDGGGSGGGGSGGGDGGGGGGGGGGCGR